MSLTLQSYRDRVESGSLHPKEQFSYFSEKISADKTNSYIAQNSAYLDKDFDIAKSKLLAGMSLGVKDLFQVSGMPMSCASDMLQGYTSPYTSTAVKKLEDAGALILGKLNMDEFAMGTTGENSSFGPAKNPYDHTRIPGGSSSGSAAAVAADLCIASLGTDTGGSIRLPAAMCGVVGVKPTYGRISRYGVQAMASSFDHVGVFSKTVYDGAVLTQIMSGQDSRDATTQPESNNTEGWLDHLHTGTLKGRTFALPKQFLGSGLDEDYEARIHEIVSIIERLGGVVESIDFPDIDYAVSVYYILVPAEVSTNLSRFDGIRFGKQKEASDFSSIYDYYAAVRTAGFGDEVKRRIITGTYVLSAGYQDAYYKKALAVRMALQQKCARLFSQYDAIIGPTSTTPAWKLGAYSDDPIALYMLDKYTVLANLIQAPAISIPAGYLQRDGVNLPIGLQIMTNKRDEKSMFSIASVLEDTLAFQPLHQLQ